MSSRSDAAINRSVPVMRYNSVRQRPEHRYAAWREGSLLSFGRMYDTEPLVPFSAETASTQLGDVTFSHTRMTSQNWDRTSDHIRRDGADPLTVGIRFEGAGRGDANGRSFDAVDGCIVLSDFAQPQSYYSETSFNAVLAIPRHVAERRLAPVRDLHGVVIAPAAAGLLRSHALAMIDALDAGIPAHQAPRLGAVMLDLLEVCVGRSVANSPVSSDAVRVTARMAAEAAIERGLSSPDLSVSALCRSVGVSRSSLYRLFEQDGGIHAYIRGRRLHCIADALRGGTPMSIGAIAEQWGYSDASHLTRSFRAEFGLPPGEFRARYQSPAAEG